MTSSKGDVFFVNHRKSGKGNVGKFGKYCNKPKMFNSEKERKRHGNPHSTSRKKKQLEKSMTCGKEVSVEEKQLEKSMTCGKEVSVEEKREELLHEQSHCDYCNGKYKLINKEFVCPCGCKSYTYWLECNDVCPDCGRKICDHQMCPCGKLVCSEEEMEAVHSDCCEFCGCFSEDHFICLNCQNEQLERYYDQDDYYNDRYNRQYLRDMENF